MRGIQGDSKVEREGRRQGEDFAWMVAGQRQRKKVCHIGSLFPVAFSSLLLSATLIFRGTAAGAAPLKIIVIDLKKYKHTVLTGRCGDL